MHQNFPFSFSISLPSSLLHVEIAMLSKHERTPHNDVESVVNVLVLCIHSDTLYIIYTELCMWIYCAFTLHNVKWSWSNYVLSLSSQRILTPMNVVMTCDCLLTNRMPSNLLYKSPTVRIVSWMQYRHFEIFCMCTNLSQMHNVIRRQIVTDTFDTFYGQISQSNKIEMWQCAFDHMSN